MKLLTANRRNEALTLVEVLIVAGIIATLVIVALVSTENRHRRGHSCEIRCYYNLKQIGLSFRLFALDHGDKFPMQLSTNQGGTLEFVSNADAWRHFQTLSNELSPPKILECPADLRVLATNLVQLSDSNISYFVGLSAKPNVGALLLSGDRTITNGLTVTGKILVLSARLPVGWSREIHHKVGNVALGDGSVQQMSSLQLRKQIKDAGRASQPIAIP